MGDAVDRLYDQNLGFRTCLPMSEALDQISSLCWKLAQWQDDLPSSLKIITSRDTLDNVHLTLGTTRLRVLLSLRYLGARVLILRPALGLFLDLSTLAASNEHQSEWLRHSGAVLLVDLVRTCNDVLQISRSILVGSQNDQNLLGAWWFSCYYSKLTRLEWPWLWLIRCSIQLLSRGLRCSSNQENPRIFRRTIHVFGSRTTSDDRHSHADPPWPR